MLYYNNSKRNSSSFSKYNIELAIKSIKDRIIKEDFYKSLNRNEYEALAYTFINDSYKNMDKFVQLIEKIDFIRKHMDNDKKTSMESLCSKLDVENYMNDVVNNWCNTNKENNLENFDFIKKLDNKYIKIIKDKFSIFEHDKKKNLRKGKLLLCSCNNMGSINCIDFLCGKCCKNKLCKRH